LNSYFHLAEEAGGEYAFHENKAYAIEWGRCYTSEETIKEFDLGKRILFLCFQPIIESMSYKLYTFQKKYDNDSLMCVSFPQVIDGKI